VLRDWAVIGVVLGPCGGGPSVRRKAARAAGYWRLGAWVVSCGDAQSGPVELQASESVLDSWLSGDALGGPVGLQVSESVWAAGCPEMCCGLPLLLLVMGRWSVVLCPNLCG
jgi:hypothetical protein